MEGIVFNLQRFSINDGPGIRTSIFFKGCPLRCQWCHNPESHLARPQLSYDAAKCLGCLRCVPVCPWGAHQWTDARHSIAFSQCHGCGQCVQACDAGALNLIGYTIELQALVDEAVRDEAFFASSGGGVTLTGGEPLAQPGFALATAKALKDRGVHVCLETCGYAGAERLADFVPYVDLFLYDIKETDPEKHKAYTGVTNQLILSNLFMLDAAGANTVLRCPLIPGFNDREEHLQSIARLANRLSHVQRIDVEPFHPLGEGKRLSLGVASPLAPGTFVQEDTVQAWISRIQQATDVPVARG